MNTIIVVKLPVDRATSTPVDNRTVTTEKNKTKTQNYRKWNFYSRLCKRKS